MQPTDPGKFTDKAWEAIVKSQEVARKYRNQQLEVEHLAISLENLIAMVETDLSHQR